MIANLSLRVRIFLFFAALGLGVVAAIIAGLVASYRHQGAPEMISTLVMGGFIASIATIGITAWIWFLFDVHVAKAIEGLAGAIRARADADVKGELETSQARYLGDLAPAAASAVSTLAETRSAVVEMVARETMRVTTEKEHLATLLSDVPAGVLVLTARHRLAFYNGVAQEVLGGQKAHIGLDRNLFDLLNDGPVKQAHTRLIESSRKDAAVDFIVTTMVGHRRLAARMRLVSEGESDGAGYVLTLRDVTAELSANARRDALLTEVFERMRPVANNLHAMAGAMDAGNGVDGSRLSSQVTELSASLDDLSERFDAVRADGWPISDTRASEIAADLARRLANEGLETEVSSEPLLLRCNAYDINMLLTHLASAIARETDTRRFSIEIDELGKGAVIRLIWQGRGVSASDIEGWVNDTLGDRASGLTGEAIITAHASDVWAESEEGVSILNLSIRQASPSKSPVAQATRSVIYDFDLLRRSGDEDVADVKLDGLNYVVFDTETTGLLPQQGDEIVQIAAVRIVNGKIVDGEVFDTLVNPGRSIPPSSTAVHGVSEAMVADAPCVLEVVERFHQFAKGAVLVAHNAPFDMEFLRRRERELGLRFDNPIFDTVLLSAVIFGQSETHSLDALTHRLGITIPEEARHTAIGDTVATAEAFIKLMAMLQSRGLKRFGDVISEVKRHGRLLKDLN